MKKALITGISGQDGSYLTELLLDKSYEVHGIIRRSSSNNTSRITHLLEKSNPNPKKLKIRGFPVFAENIDCFLNTFGLFENSGL